MTVHHDVNPNARGIDPDDLASWLLFFLESHGAEVTLRAEGSVRVNLDPVSAGCGDGRALGAHHHEPAGRDARDFTGPSP